MLITDEFIKSLNTHQDIYDLCYDYWVKVNKPDLAEFMRHAVKNDHFDDANWLFCRVSPIKKVVKYAIHAAELALPIFEKKYPKDHRPRKAIEAAKSYLSQARALTKAARERLVEEARAALISANNEMSESAFNAACSALDAEDAAAEAKWPTVRTSYWIPLDAAEKAYMAAFAAVAADKAYTAERAESATKLQTAKSLKIQLIEYAISLINTEESI